MAKFYHIDRLNRLNVGDEIKLAKYNDISGPDKNTTLILQGQVNFMFPDGVSSHGEQYYISGSLFNDTSYDIELIFELYRRIYYPDKISRFQAFFCVEKENILKMLNRLRANINEVTIYEIECEEYEKFDMNLLNKGSNLVNTVYAQLYWSGDNIGNPLYEVLAKPPIKIIRTVTLNEII